MPADELALLMDHARMQEGPTRPTFGIAVVGEVEAGTIRKRTLPPPVQFNPIFRMPTGAGPSRSRSTETGGESSKTLKETMPTPIPNPEKSAVPTETKPTLANVLDGLMATQRGLASGSGKGKGKMSNGDDGVCGWIAYAS